jgi:hypothetical protein
MGVPHQTTILPYVRTILRITADGACQMQRGTTALASQNAASTLFTVLKDSRDGSGQRDTGSRLLPE